MYHIDYYTGVDQSPEPWVGYEWNRPGAPGFWEKVWKGLDPLLPGEQYPTQRADDYYYGGFEYPYVDQDWVDYVPLVERDSEGKLTFDATPDAVDELLPLGIPLGLIAVIVVGMVFLRG